MKEGPQIRPVVAITTGNGLARAHVYANPLGSRPFRGVWNIHTHAGVPFAVLLENLCRLVECRTGEGQGTVQRTVLTSWDIEPAVLPSCGGGPSDHDPQVKPVGPARALHFCRIKNVCRKKRQLERPPLDTGGFLASLVVNPGAAGRPSHELLLPFGAGLARRHRGRNLLCGIRMQPCEQCRQRRKGVSLDARGEEFNLESQSFACHITPLTQGTKKPKPHPAHSLRSRPTMDRDRSLRLQAARAPGACRCLPVVPDRHAGPRQPCASGGV